jgi:hypothetical protein
LNAQRKTRFSDRDAWAAEARHVWRWVPKTSMSEQASKNRLISEGAMSTCRFALMQERGLPPREASSRSAHRPGLGGCGSSGYAIFFSVSRIGSGLCGFAGEQLA